ncbi:peroxiredoxin [Albimonas sp. CAU 1670]|uniref:peroxiredoxin n=1 Tax=Albimonas sp. CAU 1670 TaxID=3032599 RepID=UPI0023DB4652|nr:peroxiredoxin [Albimonas sp. CAU 1670]MDF2232543.1 peroxiredoxin [Albimonas sp. CAU 1670]
MTEAAAPAAGPAIGDMAPDFTLPRDGGGDVALSGLKGKPVVVYFYPKDDTSGCTKEAIEFTGLGEDFAALGAVVLGVSKDPVASHDKFKAKHDLGVTLLSDEEGAVCEAYGVWVEKSMYGRKYMGIERATYLVGPDGRIAQVWRKAKATGHAKQVLAATKALGD